MNMMYLDELAIRHPKLDCCFSEVVTACELLISAYRQDKKVLVCGNGGSCADADHIVGELMKGFLHKRPLCGELRSALSRYCAVELVDKLQTPLRAINLCCMPALSTAFANDVEPDYVFAQLALCYTDAGDVFIGISTSGNAKNVRYASITAKAKGARLVGLTGIGGGEMCASDLYDVTIRVPETVTHFIQEKHIAIYHAICLTVEHEMFEEK